MSELVPIIVLLIGLIIIVSSIRVRLRNERLKYEFITIIAHKFRTPLTHVKWSAGELISNEQDAYRRQSLMDIQQSNENLIKLTNTLIELTDTDSKAVSTYTFEKLELCELVRRVSSGMKDMFHEKNIFFSVICSPQPIYVKIDKERMSFVIQAMLENALLYTSSGKNVDVRISASHRHATVTVEDHGIGIDPADMPQIFTKFFRTKQAKAMDTEGFGVGLYLARAITARHKGALTATSEGLGKGSTFTLTLKRVP